VSTFAELKLQLQDLGYGTGDDAIQGRAINEAWRRIGRERAWSWLRTVETATTAIGLVEYSFAGNFGITTAAMPRRLESLRLVENLTPTELWPLAYVDPSSMSDVRGALTTPLTAELYEMPDRWTNAPDGIVVWPPPDQSYELVLAYTRAVPALTAPTDTPIMPVDYHDAIVYEAAWLLASRQRDQVMMGEMRAERDAVLAGLRAEDSVQQSGSYERIRSV